MDIFFGVGVAILCTALVVVVLSLTVIVVVGTYQMVREALR